MIPKRFFHLYSLLNSKREYLQAQLREKDKLIESLLQQVSVSDEGWQRETIFNLKTIQQQA
jgi:hypothetical protein